MTEVRDTVRPVAGWRRAAYLSLGIALVPIGVIIAPLPGPFGLPVVALGVLLIISTSRRAAGWVRLHRRRWDWFHEILHKGEAWLGGEFGRALRRTNGRAKQPLAEQAGLRERAIGVVLFPFHIALIVGRSILRRLGWQRTSPPPDTDTPKIG